MAGSGPDEEFKVTDRRRRADNEEPVSPPSPPRGSPSAASDRPGPGGAAPEPRLAESAPAKPTLEGLFVMLASSAVMAMGEAPDPATGHVRVDPAMAADAIDLLVLLREKTEGHRTSEETQLLEELIYDLQLRYVAATRKRG